MPSKSRKLDNHQKLKEWFSSNSISISPKITIAPSPLSGTGIFSNSSIPENTVLCTIPKASILSRKTCGIADLIDEVGLSGSLGLTCALMFEFSQGEASPWYDYLQTLPIDGEKVAFTWNDTQISQLKGTCLQKMLVDYKVFLEQDFNAHIYPLLNALPSSLFSLDREESYALFLKCTSWVVSRAFEVDRYHGESMVPFADLFNHKTGDEDLHMECDNEVCEECGEKYCDCGLSPEELANLRDIVDEEKEFSDEKQEDQESIEEDDGKMLELVIIKPITGSREIFNTFGDLSNTILLNRYGFVEEGNKFDVVNFSVNEFLDFYFETIGEISESEKQKIINRVEACRGIRKCIHEEEAGEDGSDDSEDGGEHHEHTDDANENEMEEDEEDSFEEDDQEPDEDCFALTIDVNGIPDGDLIVLLAFLFANKTLLTKLLNDEYLLRQWIRQLLNTINQPNGWVVQEESTSVHSTNSKMYGEIKELLQGFAKSRRELLIGDIQIEEKRLRELTNKDDYTLKCALILRISEMKIWDKVLLR